MKRVSKKNKDRMIGTLVTLSVSVITFLVYSYFGSFETKAQALKSHDRIELRAVKRYNRIDKNVGLILCYMDKKHCTPIMENKK